jgi:peptidoglycan/LPS O-acetylase OafA/YrhL
VLQKNRSVALDLLRAAAIFLVLGRHLRVCPPETSQWASQVTNFWFFGGWVGVDLFFVLSGFLVSGLLFHEFKKYGDLNVGRFLVRRGFKIYPAFWVLMAVSIYFDYGKGHFTWGRVAMDLLFMQNYFHGLWVHTWSLAVEEHFYLLLPVVLLALVRLSPKTENPFRNLPLIFLVLASACLGLRLLFARYPFDFFVQGAPSHLRMDSLFFGVVLGYCFHFHHESFTRISRKYASISLLTGIALLTPAFVCEFGKSVFLQTYGFSILYLGAGLVLIGALGLEREGQPGKIVRALAFVGSHSYSIYLWHLAGDRWVWYYLTLKFQGLSWWTYAAVYFSSAFIIGIGLSVLIEWPVLRLRDFLFPSRSKALPAESDNSAATSPLQPNPSSLPTVAAP